MYSVRCTSTCLSACTNTSQNNCSINCCSNSCVNSTLNSLLNNSNISTPSPTFSFLESITSIVIPLCIRQMCGQMCICSPDSYQSVLHHFIFRSVTTTTAATTTPSTTTASTAKDTTVASTIMATNVRMNRKLTALEKTIHLIRCILQTDFFFIINRARSARSLAVLERTVIKAIPMLCCVLLVRTSVW